MGFLSDVVDGLTGQGAAKASKKAGQLQYDATLAGIDFQREALDRQIELNKPWVDLGTESLPAFQEALATPDHLTAFNEDPTGFAFLQGNPMFQAAVDYSTRNLKGNAAASGRYNSGGLVDELFQNYLATGDKYWNNYLTRGEALTTGDVNRKALPVQFGQNAANFTGTNIGNTADAVSELTLQGANALGAGQVGASNAYSQGTNNLLNLGLLGYGLLGNGGAGKLLPYGNTGVPLVGPASF